MKYNICCVFKQIDTIINWSMKYGSKIPTLFWAFLNHRSLQYTLNGIIVAGRNTLQDLQDFKYSEFWTIIIECMSQHGIPECSGNGTLKSRSRARWMSLHAQYQARLTLHMSQSVLYEFQVFKRGIEGGIVPLDDDEMHPMMEADIERLNRERCTRAQQRKASRAMGVSPERLRNYQEENYAGTISQRHLAPMSFVAESQRRGRNDDLKDDILEDDDLSDFGDEEDDVEDAIPENMSSDPGPNIEANDASGDGSNDADNDANSDGINDASGDGSNDADNDANSDGMNDEESDEESDEDSDEDSEEDENCGATQRLKRRKDDDDDDDSDDLYDYQAWKAWMQKQKKKQKEKQQRAQRKTTKNTTSRRRNTNSRRKHAVICSFKLLSMLFVLVMSCVMMFNAKQRGDEMYLGDVVPWTGCSNDIVCTAWDPSIRNDQNDCIQKWGPDDPGNENQSPDDETRKQHDEGDCMHEWELGDPSRKRDESRKQHDDCIHKWSPDDPGIEDNENQDNCDWEQHQSEGIPDDPGNESQCEWNVDDVNGGPDQDAYDRWRHPGHHDDIEDQDAYDRWRHPGHHDDLEDEYGEWRQCGLDDVPRDGYDGWRDLQHPISDPISNPISIPISDRRCNHWTDVQPDDELCIQKVMNTKHTRLECSARNNELNDRARGGNGKNNDVLFGECGWRTMMMKKYRTWDGYEAMDAVDKIEDEKCLRALHELGNWGMLVHAMIVSLEFGVSF